MRRDLRVLAITAGLSAGGTVCGAAAGATALAIALTLSDGSPFGLGAFGLFVAGMYGAVLGAVVAPALAWLLLRRVPLGRAFLNGSSGTVFGGVLGWIIPLGAFGVDSALLGAIAGCVIASVSLRSRVIMAEMLADRTAIDWRRADPHHPSRRVH